MSRWVRVASVREVAPGTGKVVEAEGQSLALFNVDGTFYALDNTCTHVGGPLGEGALAGEVVACPWHGAEFNVRTGAVLSPPARQDVRPFSVRVEGEDVLVELD
ncbi:MAG TPA: non-heme iron oxygenase ferredoxin subunit [Gemmataceae bacterium]|nr:non-heme iron oxygenase ferredoxin subunit [Gemmataceae bacterium]